MDKGVKPVSPIVRDLDAPLGGQRLSQHTVTVGWGDCDPAQIAYTARIPEWALTAIENWYRECLLSSWFAMNVSRGIGTPFVSLACDFHVPVTSESPLTMDVFVTKMGNTSLSHLVEGFQDNQHCFSVKTTAAFVNPNSMTPIPIPDNMRETIENYTANQGHPAKPYS